VGNPIEDCMRDFAMDQLNKEVRGEHTYLDDIPDEEFMIGEASFYARMANKGLNEEKNRKLALEMMSVAKKILEDKLK
jgi:hypothetical protein